jgi:hypothetical protein
VLAKMSKLHLPLVAASLLAFLAHRLLIVVENITATPFQVASPIVFSELMFQVCGIPTELILNS